MFETTIPTGLLHIPEQKDGGMESFDPNPRAVEKWVKALPRADIGETTRMVYKALHELNRCAVSGADRFRIAELFREPVQYLSMSLKKHYIGLPFPLARKKQKVALLARELCAEMATSYKIIIESKLANDSKRLDQRMMTTTIHRAVRYLGQVLQRCYQIYVPTPNNLWREIHGLYLYAHASNLHNIVITDEWSEHDAASTIMELYKRIILLALAGPYRLRQTEMETLAGLLTQWSSHTQINEIVDPEQQSGMCSLNLNSDDPPGYLTLCGDANISYCRVLETTPLINIIGDFIANGVAIQSPGALGKTHRLNVDVLRRLALTWGGMAKRNFARTNKNNRILVTLGLPAIFHFIGDAHPHRTARRVEQITRSATGPAAANEPARAPLNLVPIDTGEPSTHAGTRFGERPSSRGPHAKSGQPTTRKKDAWNPLYKLNTPMYDAIGKKDAKASTTAGSSSAVGDKHEIHVCSSVNESAGGFCFIWIPATDVEAPNLSALVGELIGLQDLDDANKSRWSVGVVRWMKNSEGQQLELGVQKLSPYALAAGVSKDRNKNKSEFYSCLVLPEIMNVNQPVTLITPNSYDVGDSLIMDLQGERKSIRLTKLLESTGSFAHFRYKEYKKSDRSREASDDQKENFDNLWPSL